MQLLQQLSPHLATSQPTVPLSPSLVFASQLALAPRDVADRLCLVVQPKLLSEFSFPAPMQMRQAPRIIPPALLKDVRQVEFVGYVANPKHKRGMPPGEATAAVAALRNMRQQPKQASSSPAVTAQNRFACQLLLLTGHAFGHAEFMLWSCFGHNPSLALALDLQALCLLFCRL